MLKESETGPSHAFHWFWVESLPTFNLITFFFKRHKRQDILIYIH